MRTDIAYYEMAMQVLKWLCVCRRPLTLIEAAECLATTAKGRPCFDTANRLPHPRDLFVVCSSLLSAHDGTTREEIEEPVSLAHYSVKEYLLSGLSDGPCSKFHIDEPVAHAIVAKACIVYLLHLSSSSADEIHTFPLAEYASHYWHKHVDLAAESSFSDTVDSMTLELMESSGAMLRLRQLEKPHYPSHSWTNKSGPHWAAYYGFERITERLLDSGRDIDAKEETGKTPLHDAVRFREVDLASILLRRGANINTLDEVGGTALHYAIFNEDDDTVRVLLKAGADPNLRSKFGRPPLFSAAERGNPTIVQALLEYHSDINSVCCVGQKGGSRSAKETHDVSTTALQAAVWSGHKEVVERLLENGAEIDDEGLDLLARGQFRKLFKWQVTLASFTSPGIATYQTIRRLRTCCRPTQTGLIPDERPSHVRDYSQGFARYVKRFCH